MKLQATNSGDLIAKLRRHRQLQQQIDAAQAEQKQIAHEIHKIAQEIGPGVSRIHGPFSVPDPQVGHWLLYVNIIHTDIKVIDDLVPERLKSVVPHTTQPTGEQR